PEHREHREQHSTPAEHRFILPGRAARAKQDRRRAPGAAGAHRGRDQRAARRGAGTETGERAREWLRGKVAETGAVEEIDEAGNQWFTLAGASDRALLIGGATAPGRDGGRPW